MKTLFLVLSASLSLFSGCASASAKPAKKVTARVTYYTAYEDKWGNKVAASPKLRAKEGVTVAAHPDFPFGKNIEIPALKGIVGDGKFIVQDRGTAVTSKKASKGNNYVFDVFLSKNNIQMQKFASDMPQYMEVLVF